MPKEKYDPPDPRRCYTIMPAEEAASGKKSHWTELEISGRVRSLSSSLWSLSHLTALHINDNNLSRIPPDIAKLPNLLYLNLSSNKLRSLPAELGNMVSLRELLLNNNLLRVLPYELGRLFQLQTLGLKGNPLSQDILNLYQEPDGTRKLLNYMLDNLAVNKMIKEHGDLFSDSQCKVCSAVLISESQKLTHYQSKKHANKVRRYLSIQSEKEPPLKKLKPLASDSQDCNNGDTDRLKVCHVCNMTFYAPVVAESHYQGKVHAKNLRLKTVGPPQTPAAAAAAAQTAPTAQPKKKPADDPVTENNNSNNNNNNPDRFCSICQASFNNPLMAQQHYAGKKHRKQMTKLKLMETYGPSTAPASTLNGYPCTICNIELNSVEQYQSHISGAKHKNQMKKSGLNSTEIKPAAEQSYTSDKTYTAADELFAAGEEPYAPENTQYSEECQYT